MTLHPVLPIFILHIQCVIKVLTNRKIYDIIIGRAELRLNQEITDSKFRNIDVWALCNKTP